MKKIVRLHAFGGPENLRIEQLNSVQPGPGEVRLHVEAARITRDHYTFLNGQQFKGHGFVQPELPSRLGYEAAGIVETVGSGVDSAWIGKRVAPLPGFDESRYGVLGEQAILPVSSLCEYPSNLTAAQAASAWVPYFTAYGPLVQISQVTKGDYVTILAASSSVGLAAIQIAKDMGATIIAVSRTSRKKAELLEFGADHVIAMEEEDYVSRIYEITNGKGVRITFDPIGGPLLEKLAEASAPGGTIIEYGIMSGLQAPFPFAQVIGKGLSIRGYTMSEIFKSPESLELAKKYIIERLSDHRFEPKVAKTFLLDQIVDAYKYVLSHEQMGTVIISSN